MKQTKNLTGNCAHCGMPIEFPAESIGLEAQCPYCRKKTELQLARPQLESTIPTKTIVWTVIAVLVLVLGLVAILVALKQARGLARQHGRPASMEETNAPR